MPGPRSHLDAIRPLWRPPIRWFYLAHLQSGLGAGAGYVALMLVAYERIGSAWAATAVLLADLLPSMLLGPLLGSIVDRTSRLGCAIAADLIRAAAMAGLAVFGGTAALLVLALAAGLGNALFRPATSALLPSLVTAERLSAANALYDTLRNVGQLLGPVCAAAVMLAASPEAVLGLNAATFALSALLLCPVAGALRGPVRPQATPASLLADTRAGLRTVLGDPLARALVATSGAVMLVAGTMNVAELVLAQEELGGGEAGFALLLCAYGAGLVTGSMLGALGSGDAGLRRRYLAALALLAAGLLGSAGAGTIELAALTFAVTGAGNGLFVVTDRVLLQRVVAEPFHGRAFGLLDAFGAWGFAGAVVAGGALATAAGGRATFAIAGLGTLGLLLAACRAFGSPMTRPRPQRTRKETRHGLEVVSTR